MKRLKKDHKVKDLQKIDINPGDFLIIVYEGKKFPGMVLEVQDEMHYKVKTMTMSGPNWRWPEKDDILVYEKKDVLKKIKSPLLLNSRGIYAVDVHQ